MAESIKTITDKSQFETLFKNFFSSKEAFIKTKSGDLNIQYLGYSGGNVAFRIPRVKNVPDIILIFTRYGSNTIYASLKVIENNEDTFIFIPVKFQIISEARREDRTAMESGGGKNILYITNILSDSMIQSSLTASEKSIQHIKDKILHDLKGRFHRTRIVFIHETTIDPRMKYLQETKTPLVVSDINKKPDEKNEQQFYSYLNEIYAKDYKLSSQKEFISEVAVPIMYRNMIPFGYIQANNTVAMTDAHLTVMKRIAVHISELFKKENLFVPANEKFLVSDISRGGIGIVFKDRRQTRYFRQDSLVSLDLLLPTQEKVLMGVVVRNTTFQESGIIKIGVEIKFIDAISEVNYEEYLDKMKRD